MLCGDCLNPHFSQYHQSRVHPWTSSFPSPLSFSFRAKGSRTVVLESVRVESPPSVDFDPDMPSQETVGACLLVLTRNPVDLETPTYCPLDDTRVFNSAGMTFLLEQGLEIEICFETLEDATLFFCRLSEGSSTACGTREYTLWIELQIALVVVVGAVGTNPGDRDSAPEEVWMSYKHTFSRFSFRHSLSWFRRQSFRTLCGRDSEPQCCGKRHRHRWEQRQRTCHAHFTKRHASQRWRHEQQLSSIGLHRHVLRSRGISRFLYLSQLRSGVRIRFVDVGKLQFLSEFGEIWGFIASDKGVVFLHHDTQHGEAQITNTNGDLHQVASPHFRLTGQSWWLIFPTWRRKSSTIRLQLCLPASQTVLYHGCVSAHLDLIF